MTLSLSRSLCEIEGLGDSGRVSKWPLPISIQRPAVRWMAVSAACRLRVDTTQLLLLLLLMMKTSLVMSYKHDKVNDEQLLPTPNLPSVQSPHSTILVIRDLLDNSDLFKSLMKLYDQDTRAVDSDVRQKLTERP